MSPAEEAFRQHVAYHEAGHAVMALTLGRTIKAVAIDQGGKNRGSVVVDNQRAQSLLESSDPLSADDRTHLIEEITIRWSGVAAETVVFKNPYPWHIDDYQWITLATQRLNDETKATAILGRRSPSWRACATSSTVWQPRYLPEACCRYPRSRRLWIAPLLTTPDPCHHSDMLMQSNKLGAAAFRATNRVELRIR